MSTDEATSAPPAASPFPDPVSVAPRFARLLRAELRKIRATRGTRWLLAAVGILWLLVGVGFAVLSLVSGAPELSLSGTLLGMGASVVVFIPFLGILTMAGDWQSRDVLTVFALEPRRHLVFWAKVTTAALLGIGLLAAAALAAVAAGVIIAFIARTPLRWDFDLDSAAILCWGAGVGIASGIAYGAAVPRVAIAVVFSLLQTFVIDPLLGLVPHVGGEWFRLTAINDFGTGTGSLGPALVAFVLWLAIPLAIGLVHVQRADVQ